VDLVNPCGDGHVAQRVESVLSDRFRIKTERETISR
jgi:hypothetical protein